MQNITSAAYELHTLLCNNYTMTGHSQVTISNCYLHSDCFKMRTAATALYMKMSFARKHIHTYPAWQAIEGEGKA